MRFDAYSISEITDAIISVTPDKHDQYIIYRRLVRGEPWRDLLVGRLIATKESKRYYERLCSKVYKKLEEANNDK